MPEVFDTPTNTRQGETRPFDVLIRDAIATRLKDLHVALPAEVVAVRDNSYVDVQPLLKRAFTDGSVVDLPVCQNVPVKNLSGEDWWVKCPVAVGDKGTLLVHERSLDRWKVSGGSVDPADPRMHDLSDGEFIPGLRPQNNVIPGDAGDMVLHNGDAEVHLQKSGRFKVKNGENELIASLIALAEALATASTVAGGPFVPTVVAQINAVVSELQSLEGT